MFSDFYYDTMSLDTVDLITTPITSLSPTSILTATTETPVDLIIWATGYDLTNPPIPIIGRNSIPLSTSSGPQHLTLYGSSFSNVPNYGTLTGPHLGSFWIPPLEMYETISKYHIQIIRRLRELGKGSAVMPLREREEEWVASLAKGREEVPNVNEGCGTYYKVSQHSTA